MVTKRTEELLQKDLNHVLHPMNIVGQNAGIVIEKADGIYLMDTEGKKYIDLSSQLVCCNLGHKRKELVDTIVKVANEIDYVTTFFGISNPYVAELGEKLARLTPGDLNHFYFTCGGSESTDTAIKFARYYWSCRGLPGKYKIISMYTSYHGLAGISTNLTGLGRGSFHNPYGPSAPGFIRVPSYYGYRSMFGKVPDPGSLSANFLDEIIDAEGPDSIAAFIAEPILGSAGCIVPPSGWWPMVVEICRKYNILLIVDEVMSGFARSGKMFASEHWKVEGDLMTMAKGITNAALPFGAVAVSNKVYDAFKDNYLSHGFTYSGHPIPTAVACTTIDVYVKEKVVENADKVGDHIRRRLETEFLPLPCVGNIDGKGVFQSIELVTDKNSKKPISSEVNSAIWQQLLDNGVFTRILGLCSNRLQICPPCVITIEEVDKALDVIYTVLSSLRLD